MAFPYDLDATAPGLWDREKIAFSTWVAQLITQANDGVGLAELGILSELFPDDLLLSYGIIDGDGDFTPLYEQARVESVRALREALTLDEKLDLITVFHRVCMADDQLVQAELLVLREASEALGVSVSVLAAHLRELA